MKAGARKWLVKPHRGWAVYDGSGHINNVSFWQRNAIANATIQTIKDHWKYLKRQGFTCRQVEIREVPARRRRK